MNGSHVGIFMFNKVLFSQAIYATMPMIGIFINNKSGWAMIGSYFYFLLLNALLNLDKFDYLNQGFDLFLVVGIISITLSVIFLLNKKKISLGIYKINPELRLAYNLIPFVIGFCISISLFIIRNWNYM